MADDTKKKPSVNSNKAIEGSTDQASTKKGEYIPDPHPKYDHVQTLDATQTDPAQLKTINFKQDYVVIIRKKPFYAATAQQRTEEKTEEVKETVDNEDGTTTEKTTTKTTTVPMTDSTGKVITPDENYIRVYQVNNFSNIRVSTSIYGKRPGSCSITIRGGERVICAEKKDSDNFGWQSWDELLNGWLSVNEEGREGASADSTKKTSLADQVKDAQSGKYTAGVTERLQEIKKNYKLTDDQAMKLAAQTNGKKWTVSEANWAISKNGQAAAGTDFRNLFKTREAKYGWRFAEKCDWEPMDEVWIFGKSRSARTNDAEPKNDSRDANGVLTAYGTNGKNTNGEFKFLPIFFGYIDTVTKTFTANKGGCLISVSAQDHLKLLDLSRIVSSPTFIPGINPGGGVDIRFEKDQYGLYDLNQPLKNYKGTAPSALQAKAELKDYMLQNIMSGKYPKEIIQVLGAQAGIPDKYLIKRVEDIMEIPFLWKMKDKPGDFFNGEMKSRLGICNEVAEKLFIEFFADEEGNLVLKIPNYCLGANKLKPNNMGIDYPDDLLKKVYGAYKIETVNNQMVLTKASDKSGAAGTDAFISEGAKPEENKEESKEEDQQQEQQQEESQDQQDDASKQQAVDDAQTAVDDAQAENDQAYQAEQEADAKVQETQSQIDANSQQADELRAAGDEEGAAALDAQNAELQQTLSQQQAEAQTAHEASQAAVSKLAQAQTDLENAQTAAKATGADFEFDADVALKNANLKITVDEWGKGEHGSLYDIAQKYLGDGSQWTKLAYDNGITDPTTVKPGDTILVTMKDAGFAGKDGNDATAVKKKPGILENIANGAKKIATDIKSSLSDKAKIPNKTTSSTVVDKNTGTKTTNTATTDKNGNTTSRSTETTSTTTNADGSTTKTESTTTKNADGTTSTTTTTTTTDKDGNVTETKTTKEEGVKTLSETTDMDIPAIKSEYIVSFTLIDTDKEIFNMYEIGGESLMGIFDANKGSAMTQIRRAVPDIDSIIRFGLRPHPGIVNTPLVGNVKEAEIMGMIMLLSSQANRYSGSLTVIDDSAVKVGNPVRIHMYDEHPMKEVKIDRSSNANAQQMFDPKIFPEQAVFYVAGIERNIDPSNVSYMTLQLKAGRMMGQTSVYDIFMPFYQFYYTESYNSTTTTTTDDKSKT